MNFLPLSTELRVLIYSLIIPDSFKSWWHDGSLYTRTLSIPENILLVKRQIHTEFVETFFRFQQVDIWSPALALHNAHLSSVKLSDLEIRNIQTLRLSFDIRNMSRRQSGGEREILDIANTVKATVQGIYEGIRPLRRLKRLVVELRIREPDLRMAEFPDYFGILVNHKVSDRRYRDRWHNCSNTDIYAEIPSENGRNIDVLSKAARILLIGM